MNTFPPIHILIKNFLGSVGRLVVAIFKGKQIRVSKEEASVRLSICMSCEYFSPRRMRCLDCGCFLLMKTKMVDEECPIEKW